MLNSKSAIFNRPSTGNLAFSDLIIQQSQLQIKLGSGRDPIKTHILSEN